MKTEYYIIAYLQSDGTLLFVKGISSTVTTTLFIIDAMKIESEDNAKSLLPIVSQLDSTRTWKAYKYTTEFTEITE